MAVSDEVGGGRAAKGDPPHHKRDRRRPGVQVWGANGKILTARRRPKLLHHRATFSTEGLPLVDGLPYLSQEVARDVETAGEPGTRLVGDDTKDRFDT